MGTWGLVGFRFFTGHRLDIVCDISTSDRLRHPLSSSQFSIWLNQSSLKLTKYCACHDPGHRWNVISNAVSNRCHPPTSPNIVLATILVTNDTSCAMRWATGVILHCACHDPGHKRNVITMRWATGVTLQHHQILHLPGKKHVMIEGMIDPCAWGHHRSLHVC